MKKLNVKSFVIKTLRRASLRWPARYEALKLSRVERGLYKCGMCGNCFKKQEISVDHKEPVVSIEGFTTWDDFINRLFVGVEDLWALCRTCHDSKSRVENLMRDDFRSKRRKRESSIRRRSTKSKKQRS